MGRTRFGKWVGGALAATCVAALAGACGSAVAGRGSAVQAKSPAPAAAHPDRRVVVRHTRPGAHTSFPGVRSPRTRVVDLAPIDAAGNLVGGLTVSAHGTGMCSPTRVAYAATYRCFWANHISDPCWALRPGHTSKVVCWDAPWLASVAVVDATDVGDAVAAPDDLSFPWAVQLAGGQRCLKAVGALPVANGVYADYVCGTGPDALLLAEGADHSGPTWTFRTFLPKGDSWVIGPKVRVATAWFASAPAPVKSPPATTPAEAGGVVLWSKPATIDPGHSLDSISCPSASFCAAVDGYGYALTWNGSSWSGLVALGKGVDHGEAKSLMSVSCASTTFCVTLEQTGSTFAWNGSSWSAGPRLRPSVDQPIADLSSVSCPTASFCMAVDAFGDAFRFDGTAWSGPVRIELAQLGISSGLSVSCVSASFCASVDQEGAVFVYDGSTWSESVHLAIGHGSEGNLDSLSCASPSFCVVLDGFSHSFFWNGSTWATGGNLGLTVTDGVRNDTSVSCASASFCITSAGNLLSGTTSWTAPASFDSEPVTAVSCASESFCAAVDAGGRWSYRSPVVTAG